MKTYLTCLLLALALTSQGQAVTLHGKVTDQGKGVPGATVCVDTLHRCVVTDESGVFTIRRIPAGVYLLSISSSGYLNATLRVEAPDNQVTVPLTVRVTQLDSVHLRTSLQTFGITRLKDVDGAGIYAGKKSEVVILKDLTANIATNNARQIYAKVVGLNIYENDGGAGIQLAIGGRGLDPNRVSNFNTRQNGYDISADALGYPESYYTPPAEVVDRIEIVRGAASLQYGTQFGGILNFKLNGGPDSTKIRVVSRLTAGSWGFLNSATSVGGTDGRWKYYAFFQHKSGQGWRPDSRFNVNTGYFSTTWAASRRLSVTTQFTHMDYLEQQPGGLNDAMFDADPRAATKSRNWFKVNWELGAVLLDYDISSHLQFNSRLFGLLASRSALGIINTVVDPGGPRQYRTDSYTNGGDESRLVYTYHTRRGQPFVLLGGIRYYQGYTDRRIGNGNDGSEGTKSDFAFSYTSPIDSLSYSRYTFPNHNTALFAENIFRLTPRLSLIPGVRYESIVTKADGFYNNFIQDYAGNVIYKQPVTQHRLSRRSFVLGGIGLSYTASPSLQLYANISQNYRAINFNDMSIVNPNFRVDPNLRDETGYSADLGIRGHHVDILNYDLSLFTIDYADRIGTILLKDTTSPNTYQYTTNVSKSRNYGVEAFSELDLWKLLAGSGARTSLAVFTNLSWINARYVDSREPAYENKQVEFVPAVIVRTGLHYRSGRLGITGQYAYTARQFTDATNATTPTNNGINGMVPAYYVVDLSADYRLNRIFFLSASLNNVTNHRYYTRRADSYPGPGIVPADGRSFYMTMEVKL